RADIHPGILVDFTAKKLTATRSLFTKDLGSLIEVRIVDQQRAAFSAREIFCFVETESCQLPKCAQIPPAISSVKTMCVIFDDPDAVPACDRQNCVHFAADTRVMHNENRFRAL